MLDRNPKAMACTRICTSKRDVKGAAIAWPIPFAPLIPTFRRSLRGGLDGVGEVLRGVEAGEKDGGLLVGEVDDGQGDSAGLGEVLDDGPAGGIFHGDVGFQGDEFVLVQEADGGGVVEDGVVDDLAGGTPEGGEVDEDGLAGGAGGGELGVSEGNPRDGGPGDAVDEEEGRDDEDGGDGSAGEDGGEAGGENQRSHDEEERGGGDEGKDQPPHNGGIEQTAAGEEGGDGEDEEAHGLFDDLGGGAERGSLRASSGAAERIR